MCLIELWFCSWRPEASSQFCRDSVRSLAAAYNNGSLPCGCDTSGSTGSVCDPTGGQCPCRQHVIGRQCTKCATGFYGFPYCRREWINRALNSTQTTWQFLPSRHLLPLIFIQTKISHIFHPRSSDVVPSGCECGRRLCDEVTGRCICPPQTVKPTCEVCQEQTFSYHPLLGCENCGCSPGGINPDAGLQCDRTTGQCRWVQTPGEQ